MKKKIKIFQPKKTALDKSNDQVEILPIDNYKPNNF